MPQYSGASTPSTNDKVQAAVDWAILYMPSLGVTEAANFILNTVSAHKSVAVPGDPSALLASISAQLRVATISTSPTVGDNISALIV